MPCRTDYNISDKYKTGAPPLANEEVTITIHIF